VSAEARKQLISLQRSLYQKAYRDAHALATGNSRALLAYSQRFEKSLPDTFVRIELKELIKPILGSNIILYGDFHTLRQSQRGLLRILRAVFERPLKDKSAVIALEAFRTKDQKHIDAYLRGTLDEQQFLRKTEYHKNWGFPWPNFKMLFDFAREQGLAVIGINSDQTGKDGLRKRDDFSAKILLDRQTKHPNEMIFCLIGEHHLADEHLPRSIEKIAAASSKSINILRIMTNIDRFFFDLPYDKPLITTEYLKLKPDVYCVMNSPPWMKWQSYIMWEELRGLSDCMDPEDNDGTESEFDLHAEQTYDIDYHFLAISKSLVEFLGTRVSEAALTRFAIYSNLFSQESEEINLRVGKASSTVEKILERANIDGVYFISDSNVVLLNHLSLNNLAEAAGQFIHRVLGDFSDTVGDNEEQFLRRILKAAVGMAASKMLNPKRKCLNFEHFQQFLELNRNKKLATHLKEKRDCFRACLKFHTWMTEHATGPTTATSPLPKSIWQTDMLLNYEISRTIGLLLGYHFYSGVMSNKIPSSWMKNLFCQRLSSNSEIWDLLAKLYRRIYPSKKKALE
jgi:uncharacterized iron-regulated protein